MKIFALKRSESEYFWIKFSWAHNGARHGFRLHTIPGIRDRIFFITDSGSATTCLNGSQFFNAGLKTSNKMFADEVVCNIRVQQLFLFLRFDQVYFMLSQTVTYVNVKASLCACFILPIAQCEFHMHTPIEWVYLWFEEKTAASAHSPY